MRAPDHELKELENGPYAELLERVAEALADREEETGIEFNAVGESDEIRAGELSLRWMEAADSAYTQLAWLLHGDPTVGDHPTGTFWDPREGVWPTFTRS